MQMAGSTRPIVVDRGNVAGVKEQGTDIQPFLARQQIGCTAAGWDVATKARPTRPVEHDD
jgi:hypothetical protein